MAAKTLLKGTGKHRRAARGQGIAWSPRLIVRFRDDVNIPYHPNDIGQYLDTLGAGSWNRLSELHPQGKLKFRSLFTSVSPARLQELVNLAVQRDGAYQPPNFQAFCACEFSTLTQAPAMISYLRAWGPVRSVYFDPPGGDPVVNPADDDYWPDQGYLDPAPDGIDVEYAWNLPGGDGAGQHLIDLEQGWTLDHEDLIAHGATLLYGNLKDRSRSHGTSVLGEVCGVDNDRGCIGVAPNVGSVNVVSYFGAGKTRAEAILTAIDSLPFGGVLLVEAQLDEVTVGGKTWFAMPVEVLEAEFEAIRLATALGITVVAAAGNGGNDLDTFADALGNQVLNRTSVGFRDSGAILVAAASATAPHQPWVAPPPAPPVVVTNYGSRIDCYAWGEQITSTASGNAADTTSYTGNFAGTSAAAPIIAGAALVVQGLADAGSQYQFSAWQMRALLTDSATSTPSNDPANDRIGVMPNLRAIAEADVLRAAPDVYVRDFIGDIGDHHTDPICVSPDVIVRPDATLPNAAPDPQTAYGEGSGTEDSVMLGSQATAGQDNYVYVRVRNRGGLDAANVTAKVYWSPPTTLVAPDLWTLIGETVIPTVLSGRVLTVSNAIHWPAVDVPPTGHYCFITLVGTAADPVPAPADFLNWTNYENFIRNNNNVTWHNFNVVGIQPEVGERRGSGSSSTSWPRVRRIGRGTWRSM